MRINEPRWSDVVLFIFSSIGSSAAASRFKMAISEDVTNLRLRGSQLCSARAGWSAAGKRALGVGQLLRLFAGRLGRGAASGPSSWLRRWAQHAFVAPAGSRGCGGREGGNGGGKPKGAHV